jgi:hypothetical protein
MANMMKGIKAMSTIGKMVGTVKHTFSITNDREEKVQLTISINFDTAKDEDIRSWLASNRIIAGQRPWRKLTKVELQKLDGTTFIAQNIGQKVKSAEEVKQEATTAFDAMTPEQQDEFIKELEARKVKETFEK